MFCHLPNTNSMWTYGVFGSPDFGWDSRTLLVPVFYVSHDWITQLCVKVFNAIVKNICNSMAPLLTYFIQCAVIIRTFQFSFGCLEQRFPHDKYQIQNCVWYKSVSKFFLFLFQVIREKVPNVEKILIIIGIIITVTNYSLTKSYQKIPDNTTLKPKV